MNKYESVIVLTQNLSEAQVQDVMNKAEKEIEKVAKVTQKENLGLKKLAYEVKRNQSGYYIVYQFTLNKGVISKKAISEIEQYYRTIEEIIKFIIVPEG